MRNTTVYLVQLPDSLREMARLAAREIFPRSQLVPARTVEEALQLPGQGRQLLVIGDASEADVGLAAQTLDAGEMPRWAVVHVGHNLSDLVETVPAGECSVRLLARVFRSAMLHHELLRENLGLRGDVKTLTRRYNHDIRTPLGCINTLCILLRESIGPENTTALESVTAIHDSTVEIDTLLDRVSFVIKATGEPLPATRFAMGPVVQKALERLATTAEGRNAKVQQPGRPWPEVRAVDPWVEFVWLNLIHNAIRHGTKGAPIRLDWEQRGTEVRFSVTSKGAVPRAQRANLLRPFHLLHQQAAGGLGLSLVERLVSLQGGRCTYESGADDQSTFAFTLPAALPDAMGPDSARTRYADSRATS